MGFLYFIKNVHLKNIILTILIATTLPCIIAQGNYSEELYITEPEFVQPIGDLTVQQGSNVSLSCVVKNLRNYKIIWAWILEDYSYILSVHYHIIARNSRLSISHDGNNTWQLHISPVLLNDSGVYMCQVNTDPIIMQSGYLTVVLRADTLSIRDINNGYTNVGYYNESGRIQLTCDTPGIQGAMKQWRRGDGKDITLRNETGQSQVVEFIQGERLYLNNISRSDMGVYICEASNGTNKKTITSYSFDVRINFPPTVKAVTELVVSSVELHVTLECVLEVYPRGLTGWYRNEVKLHHGEKYEISEIMINMYTWKLRLTVKNIQIIDFGSYSCFSDNFFGKSEAYIRLRELKYPPNRTTNSKACRMVRIHFLSYSIIVLCTYIYIMFF